MSFREKAKDEAISAVVVVAFGAFRRFMDRLAKKPLLPKLQLVKKFRRLTGRETEEELREAHEEMLKTVQKSVDEYRKKP